MKVILYPDKQLKEKAERILVDEIGTLKTKKLVAEMSKIMLEKDGIGLAGPQVGISKRIIVIATQDGAIPFFNPKIVKKTWRTEIAEEGCLSVPGVYGRVKRHVGVTIEYYDIDAHKKILSAKGLLARVFQHEIDHLEGILFIDKLIKN
jgi:peptide deformylase